ncbi:tetratricopeptide repeat protein [Nonomuraea sp. NPDC050310]|uniref:tetratricopeptide repeat protein n=1 Tax=unclassified Nonomuraea TaxID=2593643 RepID=UPI0033DAFA8C
MSVRLAEAPVLHRHGDGALERARHAVGAARTASRLHLASALLVEGLLTTETPRPDHALPRLEEALGLLAGECGPEATRLWAQVRIALGRVHRRSGRHREAERELRQALDAVEPESLDAVLVLNELGATRRGAGEHDQAEAWYRRALALAESASGLGSPQAVAILIEVEAPPAA